MSVFSAIVHRICSWKYAEFSLRKTKDTLNVRLPFKNKDKEINAFEFGAENKIWKKMVFYRFPSVLWWVATSNHKLVHSSIIDEWANFRSDTSKCLQLQLTFELSTKHSVLNGFFFFTSLLKVQIKKIINSMVLWTRRTS